PYLLYSPSMTTGLVGGIDKVTQGSTRSYVPKKGYGERPVVYISWYDLARLANWYHYGKPRTGRAEVGTTEGTLETGAYDTRYFPQNNADAADYSKLPLGRNKKALYWIPNEHEWYKAAHYDPTIKGQRKYWDYPVGTNNIPNNMAPPGDQHSVNFFRETFSIGKPYFLTKVGAYKSASSYYKTYDQGGNVWEWLENWRRQKRGDEQVRGVRGGSATYSEVGVHAANTDPGNPSHEKFIWGGRLAKAHVTETGSTIYSDISYADPSFWDSKKLLLIFGSTLGTVICAKLWFLSMNNSRSR
ncbi:MAG TPA: SUMF1/EgtB/PvdO family nonheme iron enzyme, partial [Candidatus Caenarcaniphilales bacterium]